MMNTGKRQPSKHPACAIYFPLVRARPSRLPLLMQTSVATLQRGHSDRPLDTDLRVPASFGSESDGHLNLDPLVRCFVRHRRGGDHEHETRQGVGKTLAVFGIEGRPQNQRRVVYSELAQNRRYPDVPTNALRQDRTVVRHPITLPLLCIMVPTLSIVCDDCHRD